MTELEVATFASPWVPSLVPTLLLKTFVDLGLSGLPKVTLEVCGKVGKEVSQIPY